MNLYLISQTKYDDYDTYDSAVVAAESEDDARKIHPNGYEYIEGKWMYLSSDGEYREGCHISPSWPTASDIKNTGCIKAEYLGPTDRDRGVICASFNAG